MSTPIAPETSGLLLLHKEKGLTSFEALGPVKRAIGSGKAGHTGTLDKFASGLLIILLGRALKLAPWFSSCDKEYEALIRFGIETDTLDPEGAPVAQAPLPSRKQFEEILPQFTGEILQAPPAYSAIHIDGKRAYERARSGETPEMKKRPVTVYALSLENWSPPFASIRVRCSSGTYIRSLARDLALASESRAHLASLCRTKIGPRRELEPEGFDNRPEVYSGFSLENALIIAKENGDSKNDILNAIQAVDTGIFERLGILTFFADSEEEKNIIHGKPLVFLEERLPQVPVIGAFSWDKRRLIAVLERKNKRWSYGYVFGK